MNPKRYSLVLPEELYNELLRIADQHRITVEEAMRKAIKLFLMVESMEPGRVKVTVDDEEKGLILFESSQE